VNSTSIAYALFAGQGDYGGRYWAYRRPGVTFTAATSGTIITCPNGLNQLKAPATACADPTPGTAFNNTPAHDALGYWCSTCHDRYMAPGSASRSTDSGDPGYHYRHRAAGNGSGFGTGVYTCVDCHNAHGTSAVATTRASGASYAGGSVLLKADNRAICVRCHGVDVNFWNVVTSPTARMQTITYP
jgi:hypothetical protein